MDTVELRHAAYNSLENSAYKLQLPTSIGTFSIPRLQGTLTLDGRDSKVGTNYGMEYTYILPPVTNTILVIDSCHGL